MFKSARNKNILQRDTKCTRSSFLSLLKIGRVVVETLEEETLFIEIEELTSEMVITIIVVALDALELRRYIDMKHIP